MTAMITTATAAVCLCLLALFPNVVALAGVTVRSAAVARPSRTTKLAAVSKRQVAALDGAEWASLQAHLLKSTGAKADFSSSVGYMTVVTGTTSNQDRVVGIQAPPDKEDDNVVELDSSTSLYANAMATIPKSISDQDAISTLVGSLVGIHCALPKVESVGGSEEESFVSGKVVVLGGNDYASFAAEGLSALGAQVVQVTTGKPKKLNPNSKVQVMTPAVGELDLGFASVIGNFDSLVDTIDDEAKLGTRRVKVQLDGGDIFSGLGGVVEQLRNQHNCQCYISTLSHSQLLLMDEGVLWGPGKASKHVNDIAKKIDSGKMTPIVPPSDFSSTLQTLLDQGVTYTAPPSKGKVLVRGWSLSEIWEHTSWPRDSTLAAGIRYGLPLADDLEGIAQERLESDPFSFVKSKKFRPEEEEEEFLEVLDPHVMTIRGVDGLQRDIIASKRDCLLFLSAPFCRTCRKLSPQYSRMARESTDKGVQFAKADATGKIGKALGRALDVVAVPAFILFREGEVYGSPLAVSRLPSKKLERAIDYLATGMEWDEVLFEEESTK